MNSPPYQYQPRKNIYLKNTLLLSGFSIFSSTLHFSWIIIFFKHWFLLWILFCFVAFSWKYLNSRYSLKFVRKINTNRTTKCFKITNLWGNLARRWFFLTFSVYYAITSIFKIDIGICENGEGVKNFNFSVKSVVDEALRTTKRCLIELFKNSSSLSRPGYHKKLISLKYQAISTVNVKW